MFWLKCKLKKIITFTKWLRKKLEIKTMKFKLIPYFELNEKLKTNKTFIKGLRKKKVCEPKWRILYLVNCNWMMKLKTNKTSIKKSQTKIKN